MWNVFSQDYCSSLFKNELADKKWWINDFKMDELHQIDDNELWRYKLLRSGNIYGLIYDVPNSHLN